MNIYEKIEKIAKQKGYSIAALEKECGFGNGLIKKWTTSKPSFDKLQKVADTLKVNVNYFSSKTDKSNNKNEKAVPDNLIPISGNEIYMFPVIGTISAGYDGIAEYNPSGEEISIPQHLLKSHDPDDYFVLEVRGNSMFPLYLDGDKVLIRKCTSVDSGKIAAIGYDGEEATLKKVEYVKGENWMRLIPRNPEYPTKTIRNGDLELCRIYGEVVYLFRDNVGF